MLNLYPFEREVSANPDATLDEIVENIDIGGPAMLRARPRTSPASRSPPIRRSTPALSPELDANGGALSAKTRFALSVAAFNRVAQYDAHQRRAFGDRRAQDDGARNRNAFPAQANSNFVKVMDLRYGENPHQQAAFYRDLHPAPGSLATFAQLQGKELSFNNIADSDAAWECVRQFDAPACVIVKHANPRRGRRRGAGDAYELAYATDPTSAFGGIIAFNVKLDARPRARSSTASSSKC